jgi:nucleoid-associated protein YgaU
MAKKIVEDRSSTDSYVSMALGLAVVLLVGAVAFNYISKKPPVVPETKESNQTEKTETNGSLPTTYIIKDGDTLWSIAENYYKSGYNWVNIRDANQLTDANLIETGQKLTIPDVKPISPDTGTISAASQNSKPKDESYTVKKGETLWEIAVTEYANGYRWVDIAKANNLVEPNIIHPGNVLKLP